MGRGFLGGIFWGLIIAGFGTLVLSQVEGQVTVLEPPVAEVEAVPAGTSGTAEPDAAADVATDMQDAPVIASDAEQLAEAPKAEMAPAADQAPVAAPEAAEDSAEIDAPDVPAEPAAETTEMAMADEPVTTGDTVRPSTPQAEEEPAEVASVPDQPAETPVVEEPPVAAQETPAEPPAPVEDSPEIVEASAPPAAPEDEGAPVVDFSNPTEVETPEEPVEVAETDQPLAETEETAPEAPLSLAEEDLETGDDAAKAEVKRLTVGTVGTLGSDASDEEPAPDAAGADAEVEFPPGTPALFRYAREFENPDNKPLMAIILIADARSTLNTADQPLPFPVSYAIDASSFAATGLMEKARTRDQEVLAIAPIAPDAAPEDVATSFEVYLNRVSEAVALMDEPVANFQVSRDMASAVVARADLDGQGILTYSRGLNAGVQVAEREGVPASVVFREIDTGGLDRAGIKRFLDQAAFRAGQQSGVVLVGHDRPETVLALLEWRLGTRAEGVILAPISAVLRSGQ